MRIRIVTLFSFLLALLTPVFAAAQGFTPAGGPPWVYADNYGRFVLQGQQPNVYTFQVSGFSPCTITQLNFAESSTFYAFGDAAALAPVFIQDNNQTNSEVVTPGSYLAPTETTCGPAITPTNAHTTFSLQSGTGGLQEALNARAGKQVTIILSSEWYKLISGIAGNNATLTNSVTPADVITNATCATTGGTVVIDVTATPWAQYGCNASHKLTLLTPAPKPSIAAGTGAGTGPTIAIVAGSSQSTGTVTLTTGTTPTASGPIFTVTFPAPDYGGGFVYAPACTVTSVGSANAYTGVVTSTAGSATTGGTLVYTATATAPTASVVYKFTYSCH
jgi:hypothetical protein